MGEKNLAPHTKGPPSAHPGLSEARTLSISIRMSFFVMVEVLQELFRAPKLVKLR